MKLLIGKALVHSLLPLHGRIRVCLGSGTRPYMEIENLTVCDGHLVLFGDIFPCSRFDVYFVLPHYVLYSIWLTRCCMCFW